MTFASGDRVHVAGFGKGIVREVRNGGRYLVEVKGRSFVTASDQLTVDDSARKPPRANAGTTALRANDVYEPSGGIAPSLDLHGHVVDEALEAVGQFLNATLLAGNAEVRIIHGRSGGKLKAALHSLLKRMPSIRGYALDPHNPGVTVVRL
ncbi:MAG: Smr/MutS family protein [Acidobacteriota bacterium]